MKRREEKRGEEGGGGGNGGRAGRLEKRGAFLREGGLLVVVASKMHTYIPLSFAHTHTYIHFFFSF